MSSLQVLILAAGKGVRMKSAVPKVLHPVGGVPMLGRVIRSVQKLAPSQIGLVVGHQSDQVQSYAQSLHPRVKIFRQKNLNGSGGAVRQALSWIKSLRGHVLVTCGDTPLLTPSTYQSLLLRHRLDKNSATVLTTNLETPFGYGRIVRNNESRVERIVEELDASDEERKIQEINTGTYCFDAKVLARIVPKLKNDNHKKEYYLTDVLELIAGDGGRVGAAVCDDASETLGINSRSDLAQALAALNQRTLASLMAGGVTIVDPQSTYIEEAVKIGPDTVVWPQSFIQGETAIGRGCEIGPWAFIKNCSLENKVIFKASFAEDAVIKTAAKVGPYSRVRPQSVLGPHAHLGNFSEVKNAQIGAGSKINHLSYLGDATLGKNVNIGAGTITCNYDGIKKFPTFIQDQAFIGSNVNLIAPVKIGAHAVIGAGSNISEDVPAWALSVERAAVKVKRGWAKKKFREKGTSRRT